MLPATWREFFLVQLLLVIPARERRSMLYCKPELIRNGFIPFQFPRLCRLECTHTLYNNALVKPLHHRRHHLCWLRCYRRSVYPLCKLNMCWSSSVVPLVLTLLRHISPDLAMFALGILRIVAILTDELPQQINFSENSLIFSVSALNFLKIRRLQATINTRLLS